ncbi:2683_t:CDS:2 [Funneliformis geosporum]|nr:2683_t:CDS:2 [Funneliformis geosporum]
MSLNMDKAIRGATKQKRAAPKKKYLDVLIPATSRDDTLETMFMSLDYRLKEHSWTVVFKSLIVIHILMRLGKNDRVLNHLVKYPGLLNVSGFKDKSGSHVQTKNIHAYAIYLEEKVAVYRELKIDFIKATSEEGIGRLRKLTVAKGLLREVKILQRQLAALLNCKFYLDEVDNEITLLAFRLLVKDLLVLFQAVNEGVINVLDQFFEMSKIDAKDALRIYKAYVKQTERVVDYLGAAKNIQVSLGIDIPNLKHAPISLTSSLEDYVNDPDFENNRAQFKCAREKRYKTPKEQSISRKLVNNNKPFENKSGNDSKIVSIASLPAPSLTTPSNKETPTKEIDFIDFFASIEKEHTVIFDQNTVTNTLDTNSLPCDTATNPFLVMQNQSKQFPMRQNLSQHTFQPVSTMQDTNPFRSSIYVQDPVHISQAYQNPFFQSLSTIKNVSNPFDSIDSGTQFQSQLSQQAIQPSFTSTSTTFDNNPFRRLSVPPRQQTQLTGFVQSMHSQDSSASSFQSTDSAFSQNRFSSY